VTVLRLLLKKLVIIAMKLGTSHGIAQKKGRTRKVLKILLDAMSAVGLVTFLEIATKKVMVISNVTMVFRNPEVVLDAIDVANPVIFLVIVDMKRTIMVAIVDIKEGVHVINAVSVDILLETVKETVNVTTAGNLGISRVIVVSHLDKYATGVGNLVTSALVVLQLNIYFKLIGIDGFELKSLTATTVFALSSKPFAFLIFMSINYAF